MNITKENHSIYNAYLFKNNKALLTEQEQAAAQQQEIKQKAQQEFQSPEAQQAMAKQAEELKAKYATEIQQALQKDGGSPGPAVEALLKKIQAELDAKAQQQVKESLELQEGAIGRLGSLASGVTKKAGEFMSGKPQSGLGFRQEAILKHFQKLKTNIGSHLKELQRDMETTSGVDTQVKDQINKTIAGIEKNHGYTPTSSKFQDFRHKAGKFVQNVATGAILAAPVVAVAAPLAAAMGLAGAGAAAVTAGLTGGSVSMLKDLINGQKPDAKRAAVAALGAAATAGLMKAGMDHFSGHDAVPDTQDVDPLEAGHDNMTFDDYQHHADTADVENMTFDDYAEDQSYVQDPEVANRDFEITQGSKLDPNSSLDDIKKRSLEVLRSKGVMGSSKGIPVPSPAVQNVIDAMAKNPASRGLAVDLINKIGNMAPEEAQQLFSTAVRKGGDRAVRRALSTLLDN